jgi:hypothetical protein
VSSVDPFRVKDVLKDLD